MPSVLKFPLESVRRSTVTKHKKCESAKILFFTGIRYERHGHEEGMAGKKSEKWLKNANKKL